MRESVRNNFIAVALKFSRPHSSLMTLRVRRPGSLIFCAQKIQLRLSIPHTSKAVCLLSPAIKKTAFAVFFIAGDEGIEPPPKVLETFVLPLN